MYLNKKKYEDGMILKVDKPIGWTSFDIVNKIRNTLKLKKIGHAGTLDPLASGLLIVCTGKYTKKIQEYQNFDSFNWYYTIKKFSRLENYFLQVIL